MEEQQYKQPLLSEGVSAEQGGQSTSSLAWGSYQHLGRSASIRLPPPLGIVSADEIRSAPSFHDSSSPGAPSHHHLYPVVGAPNPHPSYADAIVDRGQYCGNFSGASPTVAGRPILDEVEIRQILIDHVGHSFCWGSRPARTWRISAIEDCNVYVGTLETFIEERELTKETEPYEGGKLDGNEDGTEQGVWELDLRSSFPPLFVPLRETKCEIPHSETVLICSGCEGRGEIACPKCNAGQAPGFYKANQMSPCSVCYGRGLIAHKDGSDSICIGCNGKGMLPCIVCGSRGLIECPSCQGKGSLLSRSVALVRWKTLSTRKVTAASGAASVPDEVFHNAKGVELCNTQAYQCSPAYFADSYLLNRFSSDVIADRPHVPPSAKVICERHVISVVPVTRVTMTQSNKSFSFYIIGLGREVYIKQYPAKFCWGLCCCFEWHRA